MKRPFALEPSSKLTFDWVYRQFDNLQKSLQPEDGLYLDGGVLIGQTDSPYAMSPFDNLILADPDDTSTLRVDLVEGIHLRVVRVRNLQVGGAAASVDVYPFGSPGGDLIQPGIGDDPTDGPLTLTKGEAFTLVFIGGYGWGVL
jgi:hypothetical protein